MKKRSGQIGSMIITNMDSERRKFLFDPFYNPQFLYKDEVSPEKMARHGVVSDEHLETAERILNTVIKKYESEENFISSSEGPTISRDDAEKSIQAYLQMSNIEKRVRVTYSPQYIARTAVLFENGIFHLKVRLPIDYREKNLVPILNHEIGTHIFRWLNEEQQPWHKARSSFDWENFTETEEGLAVLHYLIAHPEPYLWLQSVYYYAAYHAQFLSFSELSQKLRPFVSNLERRWKICLRVKRGFADTSEPGAYTKDKVYLAGAIKVARWLSENDYDVARLYVGKIALEDIDRAWSYAQEHDPLLPQFISSKKAYAAMIQQVIKQNRLL